MSIDSSLLYTREDGSQDFVHDSYKDFFLAKWFADRINNGRYNGRLSVEDAYRKYWSYEEDAELWDLPKDRKRRILLPAWQNILLHMASILNNDKAQELVDIVSSSYFRTKPFLKGRLINPFFDDLTFSGKLLNNQKNTMGEKIIDELINTSSFDGISKLPPIYHPYAVEKLGQVFNELEETAVANIMGILSQESIEEFNVIMARMDYQEYVDKRDSFLHDFGNVRIEQRAKIIGDFFYGKARLKERKCFGEYLGTKKAIVKALGSLKAYDQIATILSRATISHLMGECMWILSSAGIYHPVMSKCARKDGYICMERSGVSALSQLNRIDELIDLLDGEEDWGSTGTFGSAFWELTEKVVQDPRLEKKAKEILANKWSSNRLEALVYIARCMPNSDLCHNLVQEEKGRWTIFGTSDSVARRYLNDENPEIRYSAVFHMSCKQEDETLLCSLLEDPDQMVKGTAIQKLADLDLFSPKIKELLTHESAYVVTNALYALAKSHVYDPRIIPLLQDDRKFEKGYTNDLSSSREVAQTAYNALEKLDKLDEVITFFEKKNIPQLQKYYLKALRVKKDYEKIALYLESSDKEVQCLALDILKRDGIFHPGIEALLSSLDSDLKAQAIRALGNLKRTNPIMYSGLNSSIKQIKMASIYAMGKAECFDQSMEAFLEDSDDEIKTEAIRAYGALRKYRPLILSNITNTSTSVANASVSALIGIGKYHPKMSDYLSDKNPDIVERILTVFRCIGYYEPAIEDLQNRDEMHLAFELDNYFRSLNEQLREKKPRGYVAENDT